MVRMPLPFVGESDRMVEMSRFARFLVLCLGAMLVLGSEVLAQGGRVRKGEEDPAAAQLKMVEMLLKVRLPAMKVARESQLSRQLDKLERHFKDNHVDIKFVRSGAESDFEKPLDFAHFAYDATIAGGVAADVLAVLCYEAGCAYVVRGGKVHVFKAPDEKVTQSRTLPDRVITMNFTESFSGRGASKLKIKSALAASKGRGKAKLTYDRDTYNLTMEDSRANLYEVNQMLDEMYFDWLRLSEAKQCMAVDPRSKHFKFESQLAVKRAVPVEFEAGCTLGVLKKYLALHMRAGGVKKPVRIEASDKMDDTTVFDDKMDFSYCTVLDALHMVCDACKGHYRVKGGKMTLIPNEREKRTYKVTHRAIRCFTLGTGKPDPRAWRKAKEEKKAVTPEATVSALKEMGIDIPEDCGVRYDSKMYTLDVDTSQRGLRNLDCLLNLLHKQER